MDPNMNMNILNMNLNQEILNTIGPREIDPNANVLLNALYELYQHSHIRPTEEDFLHQVNNYPTLYRILYWLKLEHLYPQFVEEEMDLASIRLMSQQDLVYFHVDQSELFVRFVLWLQEIQ